MARTTYHVLVRVDRRTFEDEGKEYWRYLGQVLSPSADAARVALLKEEGIVAAEAIAIPARSWSPEWFGLQEVEPRYVKAKKRSGQETLPV